MKKFLERIGSSYAFAGLEAVILIFLLAVLISSYSTKAEASSDPDMAAEPKADTVTAEADAGSPSADRFSEALTMEYADLENAAVPLGDVKAQDGSAHEPLKAHEAAEVTGLNTCDMVLCLIAATPESLSGESRSLVAGNALSVSYSNSPVGGFVLSSDNCIDARQGLVFTSGLIRLARGADGYSPLLIALDEEDHPTLGDAGTVVSVLLGEIDHDDADCMSQRISLDGFDDEGIRFFEIDDGAGDTVILADMRGVSPDESGLLAVRSFACGADMIMTDRDVPGICDALCCAIADGTLSEASVGESYMKVTDLKMYVMD